MDQGLRVYLYSSIVLGLIAFLYDRLTKYIPSRINADDAPRSRLGLVPAAVDGIDSPPARAGGIDIIFVHGLGSNPDTTWRAESSGPRAHPAEGTQSKSEPGVNWVSDFLLDDLPPAIRQSTRLFFYNYDSYWKRDAVLTRLWDLGNGLLEHIRAIRRSEEEQRRELIFVAHSHGGLVVKRAFVQAHATPDFRYITEHTKAILFLGTPHRGSSFSVWGRLGAQALLPLGSNPSILSEIEYDSTGLLDLHREFGNSIRNGLPVFNFFEQRPTRIFRLWFVQWQQFCVPEQSATYEGSGVRNIGLTVDHSGLNKFGSRTDDSYRIILSKLTEITTTASQSVNRHYAVPLETVQSFTQRDELWKELEEKMQTRHQDASIPYAVCIHGLGGAGKSQLVLKYAEKHKDRYDPILWIDATDKDTVRSSFEQCAAELGLPVDRSQQQGSALDDGSVQLVLRWLRDRPDTDNEWLFILDNADDVSWGIQKVIPKGRQGSILITSRDNQSPMLVPKGCEKIHVDKMSPLEGASLLLQRLPWDVDSAPDNIRQSCDEIARRLDYLPLAIDLAGAYIGNNDAPEQALVKYLEDYDRHRDEILQMDGFHGLMPTEKTVWTVWDTTLEKINREYTDLRPGFLLTFFAQFKGSVVQDEVFRLAARGTTCMNVSKAFKEVIDGIPHELRQFLSLHKGEWDDFRYQRSCAVLLRYNLLQRGGTDWPGFILHGLVQWRATQSDQNEPWRQWYVRLITAACRRIIQDDQPEFRRELIVHLPSMVDFVRNEFGTAEHEASVKITFAMIYQYQGRFQEAENLLVQVVETRKESLRANHPKTLRSMANLAFTYRNQNRLDEAEKLQTQVTEARKAKLGEDHLETLRSMGNLAQIYYQQGRLGEAEELHAQVTETRKAKLGEDHSETLISMGNLALTYYRQGRLDEAEELQAQVIEARKAMFGEDHPETLINMANLALTYYQQDRLDEAEELQSQVMEVGKTKLGDDHPGTLIYMANLAKTYWAQGRALEAEKLLEECATRRTRVLGARHPRTVSSYKKLGRWQKKRLNADEGNISILARGR